ncbi:MAG: selenocysteine lyase, partial [Ignavibacteriae bacterium]
MTLESVFAPYREKIVGIDLTFNSPFGTVPVVYADWTASGRLYGPIEERLAHDVGPYV